MQQFLESFANKHVSSSEDRLEETKRKKLARKCEKLVELMMVSGIPTASGYEERIQFTEMEVIDRGANETGLLVNIPEGNAINGWDVNVAGVRITSERRRVLHHRHAVSYALSRRVMGHSLTSHVGIHHPRQARRKIRCPRGQEIWRLCQAAQESTHRVSWQKPAGSPEEE